MRFNIFIYVMHTTSYLTLVERLIYKGFANLNNGSGRKSFHTALPFGPVGSWGADLWLN
jgi:hypothetical protein